MEKKEEVLEASKAEELLAALKASDFTKVDALASELFITDGGRCEWKKMKEFENFANCKFFAGEKDSFGWLIGGILFEDQAFYYG